jgi:hypothetical protein
VLLLPVVVWWGWLTTGDEDELDSNRRSGWFGSVEVDDTDEELARGSMILVVFVSECLRVVVLLLVESAGLPAAAGGDQRYWTKRSIAERCFSTVDACLFSI